MAGLPTRRTVDAQGMRDPILAIPKRAGGWAGVFCVCVCVGIHWEGQSYYSKEILQELLKARVRGVSLDFAHLENVWDWKLMESRCKMPHIKYMHRIHALCFFRVGDTVAVKWKQYLTSPDWSRPVVIVPAHLAKDIADWRPPRIPQQFDQKFVTPHLTWLHKLGVALAETPGESHQQDLEHLAAIVTGQVRYDLISLDTLITDLKKVSRPAEGHR